MKFALIHSIRGFSRITMICVDPRLRLFEKSVEYEWDSDDFRGCPAYLLSLLRAHLIQKVTLDVNTPHSIYIKGMEYPEDPEKWHNTVIRTCKAISSHLNTGDVELVEMGEVNPLHPASLGNTPDD